MSTIRARLIERLDDRIALLEQARLDLLNRSLEDKVLNNKINILLSIREKLEKQGPQGG